MRNRPAGDRAGFRLFLGGLVLVGMVAAFRTPAAVFRADRARAFAEADFRAGRFGLAAARLETALDLRPRDERLRLALGEARLEAAGRIADPVAAREALIRARQAFRTALEFCPPCAEAAYGLARTEARFVLSASEDTEPTPSLDPLPDPVARFREALALRPNGIAYRYAFIRYLHGAGETDLLAAEVRLLASIHPPAVRPLAREPFWGPEPRIAALAGVREALAAGRLPRESHGILSAFHAEGEEWGPALTHHRAAMAIQSFRNGEGDFLNLGLLLLRNRETDAARIAFDRAFRTGANRDRTLDRVYRAHRQAGRLADFVEYARSLDRFFVYSDGPELMRARALAETGSRIEAMAALERLGRERRCAEAYARLAAMAQEDGDWDAMELAAHRATALAPTHVPHRSLLADALQRQDKLDRAEGEWTLAIRHQDPPSDALFHRRALLRWRRGAYAEALEDWRSAIQLRPDHPGYRRHAQRALAQIGNSVASAGGGEGRAR